MKKLQLVALVIYFLGFGLKILHLPKNTIVMMVGAFLFLLSCLIAVFSKKTNTLFTLKSFAVALWLISLLFVLKFWPFANLLILVSSFLTILVLVNGYRINKLKELRLLILGGIACILIYFIPLNLKYYLISIKWNTNIETDYYSLDKYSWFLYQNGDFDQATAISNDALEIAKKHAATNNEPEYIEIIDRHNQSIKNKTWIEFP